MEKNLALYYFMDPLCGWCYGFKPVISRIKEEFADQLSFNLILGGMVTGDRVGPVGRMADYLKTAIPRLEDMTGVTMGTAYKSAIFDDGSMISDSTPPSLALLAAENQHTNSRFSLMTAIQDLHFQDGKDLNKPETYLDLMTSLSLNPDQWLQDWQADETRYRFNQDIRFTQQVGIQGFPAVVLVNGNTGHLVARGYVGYTELKDRIQMWISDQLKKD